MSAPGAHLQFQYAEVHKLDEQLEMMRGWGVSESDPGYKALWGARGAAIAKLGSQQPMTFFQIARSFGMSPGVISLFAAAERGWMIEARAKPGAPPIYRYVDDKVAEKIVKKELTHEEFMSLLTPDEYKGE